MPSPELDNLVAAGHLQQEPPARSEFDRMVRSGRARLADAHNASLSLDSRFDLAYNAAHSLALAALRWHGYRSANRYICRGEEAPTPHIALGRPKAVLIAPRPRYWEVFADTLETGA